jgi:cation diffusion facilitator CzcD-associated flavoprotein CzcO
MSRKGSRVRHSATIFALLFISASAPIALHAADDSDEVLRIRALHGLKTFTGVSATISGSTPTWVSKDRLKTMVELRLRQAGLLQAQIVAAPTIAFVGVDLSVVPITDIAFAVSYSVTVSGVAKPTWGNEHTEAVWWHQGGVITSPRASIRDDVEKTLNDVLDVLLNDFYKANPK